ncbi:MAG: type II toxin-antitoxin system VapC family toxin, partial [Candidatus Dormiibacterota bacterium]
GKLEAPDDFEKQIEDADFTILPLSLRHGVMGGGLRMHHRDPFDRLLIAQALCERMVIVTGDSTIGVYGAPVLPV